METKRTIENRENLKIMDDFWGDVTDPRHHNPNEFRYLVHGFNPYSQQPLIQALAANMGERADDSKIIKLIDNPECLAEREHLSCSLIDQDHTGTWGTVGLIVGAHPSLIQVTAPHDIGSVHGSDGIISSLRRKYGVLEPDTLLQRTPEKSYNEVVVKGQIAGKSLVLLGFFVKAYQGEPLEPDLAHCVHAHASRLSLPVIYIEEKVYSGKDRVEITDDCLRLYYKGALYFIQRRDSGQMTRQIRKHTPIWSSFPARQNLLEALDWAFTNGWVPEEVVTEIVRLYDELDEIHRRPQIERAVDGSLLRFSFIRGYEEAVERITFDLERKYACVVNLKGQREFYRSKLIGLSPDPGSFIRYIAEQEALKHLEEVKQLTAEDDYRAVEEFVISGLIIPHIPRRKGFISFEKMNLQPFFIFSEGKIVINPGSSEDLCRDSLLRNLAQVLKSRNLLEFGENKEDR